MLFYVSHDSYTHFNRLFPSVREFKKNPEKYNNIEIEKVGRIKDITEDYFIFIVGKTELEVKANSHKITPVKNGLVIVHGLYKKEGHIELLDVHYSPNHYIKYIISFMALVFTVFYLLKEWKITKRGIYQNA